MHPKRGRVCIHAFAYKTARARTNGTSDECESLVGMARQNRGKRNEQATPLVKAWSNSGEYINGR